MPVSCVAQELQSRDPHPENMFRINLIVRLPHGSMNHIIQIRDIVSALHDLGHEAGIDDAQMIFLTRESCFSTINRGSKVDHPMVGVARLGPKVSDRMSSLGEEPPVGMKISLLYSCWD